MIRGVIVQIRRDFDIKKYIFWLNKILNSTYCLVSETRKVCSWVNWIQTWLRVSFLHVIMSLVVFIIIIIRSIFIRPRSHFYWLLIEKIIITRALIDLDLAHETVITQWKNKWIIFVLTNYKQNAFMQNMTKGIT